mgnify:CR=1 FL=1
MRTFLLSLLACTLALPAMAADEHYTVAAAPLALKVGANGNLVVTIKPAPGLHFNKEYPAKFTLTANPNVKAAKEKFSAKDGDVKTAGNDGQLTVALTGVKAGETEIKIRKTGERKTVPTDSAVAEVVAAGLERSKRGATAAAARP